MVPAVAHDDVCDEGAAAVVAGMMEVPAVAPEEFLGHVIIILILARAHVMRLKQQAGFEQIKGNDFADVFGVVVPMAARLRRQERFSQG